MAYKLSSSPGGVALALIDLLFKKCFSFNKTRDAKIHENYIH